MFRESSSWRLLKRLCSKLYAKWIDADAMPFTGCTMPRFTISSTMLMMIIERPKNIERSLIKNFAWS